ncbi:MAG: LamG domain-containing protein, partial [Saprospiraceae bacterium]|nr:LamG domain-containing protein [Saprospiraceae bacterium]
MIQSAFEIGLVLSSLLFYVDFDSSFDAVYSVGNGSARIEVDRYKPVITSGNGGMFGEAAEFIYEDKLESIWTKDVVRYAARGNFPYTHREAFHGTIGMWLKIDIEQLMGRSLIWLDPVHLLAENDHENGKIWMDFVTSELPDSPVFRFGATSHRRSTGKQGNPDGDHVIVIPHIDFSGDSWHHIVGTWKNLNGTGNTGILQLYFDSILVGEIKDFDHPLDWNIDDWEIRIGLGFKGKIDDFFIL